MTRYPDHHDQRAGHAAPLRHPVLLRHAWRAAMEYDVTMFFTIDGTLLLKKGLAETVYPKAGGKPVSEFIQDALDAGVKFLACTASTELHDLQPADLIDGVKMVGGASMWQLAEECKTVLTF